MMRVVLDGKKMKSSELTHEYLKKKMNFPVYYGRNLDALYDQLTGDDRIINIYLINCNLLNKNLGDYGKALLCTLQHAMHVNSNIKIFLFGELRRCRGKLYHKKDKK